MNENLEEETKPDAVEDTTAPGTHAEVDDDDWSRQVEMDETTAGGLLHEDSFRMMESVVEDAEGAQDEEAVAPPPMPSQPKLSMKEKLVLRERQRRIETERARLKRQFAQSIGGTLSDDNLGGASEEESASGREAPAENGSVAGTLGKESTVAHADEETAEEANLGFNMERFLRNSDSFHPELEPTSEDNAASTPDQGVVMERFLSDPVVVASTVESVEETPRRTVSFDVEGMTSSVATENGPTDRTGIFAGSLSSFGEDTLNASMDANASILVQVDDDDDAQDRLSTMALFQESGSDVPFNLTPASDEPRVLRLTEADMEEMAAIEEASIGNAPPSEREEMLSEIGELADFGGHNIGTDAAGNLSQDTPTTAMESSSQISGNQSGQQALGSEDRDTSATDHHSLDGMPPASESSHLLRSPGASANDTVTANPPSESDHEQLPPVLAEETSEEEGRQLMLVNTEKAARAPDSTAESDQDEREGLVNRRIRPGMVPPGMKPPVHRGVASVNPVISPIQVRTPMVVDGFDFDKNAPTSPFPVGNDDSFQNLPADVWSPRDAQSREVVGHLPPNMEEHRDYGAMENGKVPNDLLRKLLPPAFCGDAPEPPSGESVPLLGDVPGEIITRRQQSDGNAQAVGRRRSSMDPHRQSIREALDSVFSDVRSEDESEKEEIHNESEHYLKSSMFARAIPERLIALTVTLLFEIPVLLMISGGSDALCMLIGRSRYQLLIGFLPLTSAISGNVGLQASTLTTRAISHAHVTADSYVPWLLTEIGAASYLGVGMGIILGSIAFFASGMDTAFGMTIAFAQFLSVLTAGITGTLAPLLFSFIFKRDSGKWGGPLETAIQDIVGSFAMVVVSYRLLLWFGTGPVDPNDVCGAGDADTVG